MLTEQDFLAGIASHPLEYDRWLILSDWLEDHADPRAELARLRYHLQTEPDHPQREQRLARQLALLADHAPVVPTWTNALGMDFALILPGTFMMGSPESEEDREDDETLHSVTLTRPYHLGVYPVTVGEFAAFVKANQGFQTEAERGDGAYGWNGTRWEKDARYNWRNPGFAQTARHPVVCVSWNDAQAMLEWLNEVETISGLVYSLPMEAQWEYACRAGSNQAYFWGDDVDQLDEYAWFDENAYSRTHPVETKKPNPWGLWHLHGLVWEWCQDWWEDYPTGAVRDPLGRFSDGSYRVLRGGGWRGASQYCRSARRGSGAPGERGANCGFRLAVSVR